MIINYIVILTSFLSSIISFNFQFKNEWDCLEKVLFSPDIMTILLDMNELHCDYQNVDFAQYF